MNSGLENLSGYYESDNQQRQFFNSTSTWLFAADLPDDTCEEDLSGFFKGYNLSSSKVIQGINRTYAFVNFQSRQDAEKARLELNGVTLQAKYATGTNKVSKPVRLCRYETKALFKNIDPRCNLLVKNLSPQVSAHLLFNTFIKFGDIRSSKLVVDIIGESKGFGFISYYKLEDSLKAYEQINESELGGKKIKINFLEKGRPHEIKRNNIYVKEIPKKNFGDAELIALFKQFGQINSAIVLKDEKGESKGFGFVCFEKPEEAAKAVKEMNGKTVFNELENKLYVSFALKKAERKEELIKIKEKIFKESQKMTIYSKIQDDQKISNEEIFKNRILEYLQKFLSPDYKPKYIKVRMDQKNAFITMQNKDDVKTFIKKFQELQNEKNDIYFNTYKSKFERANAQQKFKNYNNFSETGSFVPSSSSSTKGGKIYNNFGPVNIQNAPNNFPKLNNPKGRVYQNYNNFTMPNQMNQIPQKVNYPQPQAQSQPRYVTYNNFNNLNNNVNTNINTNMVANTNNNMNNNEITFNRTYELYVEKLQKSEGISNDKDLKEQAGDFIYELAEALYKEQAGKITGMILEYLPVDKLMEMIYKNPKALKEQIDNAHNVIEKNKH